MEIEFQGISFIITNPPLQPISLAELSAVEAEIGCLFPEDYRAFVTTFGEGEINLGIRVFSPKYILNILSETRKRFSEHWFWDENPNALRVNECIPFFDSPNGDDIIFHPSDRDRWYILPHETETVFTVNSFQELCDLYLKFAVDDEDIPDRPPFAFSG